MLDSFVLLDEHTILLEEESELRLEHLEVKLFDKQLDEQLQELWLDELLSSSLELLEKKLLLEPMELLEERWIMSGDDIELQDEQHELLDCKLEDSPLQEKIDVDILFELDWVLQEELFDGELQDKKLDEKLVLT